MDFNESTDNIIFRGNGEAVKGIYCTFAGTSQEAPDSRTEYRPSHDYVFEYVRSGRGHIETAVGNIELSEGIFYCFRRGTHITCYADADEPYEKIRMSFGGEMLERLFDFFLIDSVLAEKCCVLDLFFEVHDRLERMNERDSSDAYADIMVLLFRILTSATKKRFFPSELEMNSLDEKIRAYIDSNIYSDLSLDKITQEFGISKMHVIRVFKAKFNVTPMQYLIDRKISVAKSLLTDTVMPIKEIAALLRYSNTQHFASSFKNIVGCTPNKYRQIKQTQK